jgi:hypothetical protein
MRSFTQPGATLIPPNFNADILPSRETLVQSHRQQFGHAFWWLAATTANTPRCRTYTHGIILHDFNLPYI